MNGPQEICLRQYWCVLAIRRAIVRDRSTGADVLSACVGGAIVMLPLEGKVAVITGGTSGIGARTAEVFVANGARVVIAGRRHERGEKLARKLGADASFVRTDVSIEAEVRAMIDHAVNRFGRLDCLLNNAGRGSQFAAIADVDLEQF